MCMHYVLNLSDVMIQCMFHFESANTGIPHLSG